MPSFFLALLTTALATLAGREAVRVARLAAGLGSGAGLLVAAWLAAALAAALAAWLGARIAAGLHPDAKAMLVAFALLLAGIELLVMRNPPKPEEPTRSFGAIALVLAAGQLTGAAGLLAFALAAASGVPLLAGAGAALGIGAALTCAWALAEGWEGLPLRPIRYAVAGLLMLAALATGLSARGLI